MRAARVSTHQRAAIDGSDGDRARAALSVTELCYAYPSQREIGNVLQDVSFEIADGEFVAVMGPSGCGKSTLLNLVAGFDHPRSGQLRCFGAEITRPGADRGVVFQKPTLYPWLTVLDNVMFGLKARRAPGEHSTMARQMLMEVGLSGFESYKPYELSGGMQHRVALARTLVNEPRLLLMDEPFAALDAQTRSVMQELVLQIRERHNSSVFFVTHDIEEGLLLADKVVILGGRPSSIKEIVTVDLPRPRGYDIVMSPHFTALRKQVRQLINAGGETSTRPLA